MTLSLSFSPSATSIAAAATLLLATAAPAQMGILASYPLANDLLDAVGTNGPVTLHGTTAGPADGVCVFGTYGFPPGSGDEVYTPGITGFDETDFEIDVDFVGYTSW